jgi:phospholipid N-methyltransferase
VPLSTERKRKRLTSASSGSGRRTRKKTTTVQEYIGSDGLFTKAALKESDDLKDAQLKHFEASKDFEDTMLGLMTLRTLIINHGALEEEVTEEWEHSR